MRLELVEAVGGDFDVFEIVGAVGAEDGFFVAFAEDEDEVAFVCEGERALDGFGAVEDDEEVLTLDFAGFEGTLDELVGDFGGVFVAGIVFGDDDSVGVFAEDFATDEAGGFVATAGTAVKGDDLAVVVLDRGEDLFEGVGGVGVVDDDSEILAGVDAVHATFDRGEGMDARADLGIGEAEAFANGEGGKGIIDVELAGDLGFDFEIVTRIGNAGGVKLDVGSTEVTRLDAVGLDAIGWKEGGEVVATRVVGIDDAVFGVLEKLHLGGAVVCESFVVIEVLVGEVGENGDFDRDAIGAELGEGMRGGFEDEKFSAGVGDGVDALV